MIRLISTRWLAAMLMVAMLAGCASNPPASLDRAGPRAEAARVATQMVGVPYRPGGRQPSGFDCSGLVFYAYAAAGVQMPRTSRDQFNAIQPLSLARARPGDLVFFKYGRTVSHVGIYLGDQRFVHAPSSGRPVSIDRLDTAHYRKHFVAAGRVY